MARRITVNRNNLSIGKWGDLDLGDQVVISDEVYSELVEAGRLSDETIIDAGEVLSGQPITTDEGGKVPESALPDRLSEENLGDVLVPLAERVTELEATPPVYRGAWTSTPEILVAEEDFSGATLITGGSQPSISTPPGSNGPAYANCAMLHKVDSGTVTATIDFTGVMPQDSTPSRVTFFRTRAARSTFSSASCNMSIKINGVNVPGEVVTHNVPSSSTTFAEGWTEVEVSPSGPLQTMELQTSGASSFAKERWLAVAGVKVYAIDESFQPYGTGQTVVHEGRLWSSDLEDNTSVPGVADWTDLGLATQAALDELSGTVTALDALVDETVVRVTDLEATPPVYRGDWTDSPGTLVYSEDFSVDTGDWVTTTRTAMGSAIGTDKPAYSHAGQRNYTGWNTEYDMMSLNLGTLPELSGLTPSLMKMWVVGNINATAARTVTWRVRSNGVEKFAESAATSGSGMAQGAWELVEFADPSGIVKVTAQGSSTTSITNVNVAVAGVEIYVPDESFEPYNTGQVVSHNGSLWESDVDSNAGEPGVSGWTQVLSPGVLLLESGQGAPDVPSSTPVGTIVFTKV